MRKKNSNPEIRIRKINTPEEVKNEEGGIYGTEIIEWGDYLKRLLRSHDAKLGDFFDSIEKQMLAAIGGEKELEKISEDRTKQNRSDLAILVAIRGFRKQWKLNNLSDVDFIRIFDLGRQYERFYVEKLDELTKRGGVNFKSTSSGGNSTNQKYKKKRPKYQPEYNKIKKRNPNYSKAGIIEEVAERFNVTPRTVSKYIIDKDD